MVMGFDDSDALPRLSNPAFACLIGLMLAIWLFLRVRVVQRQLARGSEPTTRLRFIVALAGWPGTIWVLGLLALGLGVGVVLLR